MSEEVIHESWLSRLSGAVKGILVGVVFFLGAFPLLWWNEGRAVKTAKALKEGAAAVRETTSDCVDPVEDGTFVHLTGQATTDEVLEDPDLGIAVNAIRLERRVEMYQWQERSQSQTRKKLGGGTETTKKYSYQKTWADRAIDSSTFHDPGHDNPGELPLSQVSKTAREVWLGKYQLPSKLIAGIQLSEPLPVNFEDVPADQRSVLRKDGTKGFYLPQSQTEALANAGPQLGDARISYSVTRPATVSIMSQQHGNSFTPFQTSNGSELHMLAMGNVPASEMIAAAETQNTIWTWGLRAGGFIIMCLGLSMVFKPLSVLADVLPIAGDIVQTGTGLISFCLAGAGSLATISLAWMFYRPLIGVPLLVAGIGLIVALVRFVLQARSSRSTTPVADPREVDLTKPNADVTVEDIDEAISV